MKKWIIVLLLSCCLFNLVSCGDAKVINGVYCDTYGILNKEEKKIDNIQYELIIGNIFWSWIFSETIVVPFYFIGFSLFEPIGLKNNNDTSNKTGY